MNLQQTGDINPIQIDSRLTLNGLVKQEEYIHYFCTFADRFEINNKTNI